MVGFYYETWSGVEVNLVLLGGGGGGGGGSDQWCNGVQALVSQARLAHGE